MSLIKCTECGKEISDKAQACPNCGCPVGCSAAEAPAPTSVAPTNKKRSLKKHILFILLAVIGVAGLTIGCCFLYQALWMPTPTPYTPPFNQNSPAPTNEPTESVPGKVPAVMVPDTLLNSWVSNWDKLYIYTDNNAVLADFRTFDYANSAWLIKTGTIVAAADHSIRVQFADGSEQDFEYELLDGALIMAGHHYTSGTGDRRSLETYEQHSIPIRGDLFFGMTKEEVKQFIYASCDSELNNGTVTTFNGKFMITPEISAHNALCEFGESPLFPGEQNRLLAITIFFSTTHDDEKDAAFEQAMIAAYTEQHGAYTKNEHDHIVWTNENLQVKFIDWGVDGYSLVYELVNLP